MERQITRCVKNAPVALYDIGVGPKTEWRTLRDAWPELRLFGCEPYPPTYEKLAPSWRELGGSLLNVAISDYPATLHYEPSNPKISSLLPVHKRLTHSMSVPALTLNAFDALCGRQRSVLLWMDIEGYELQALLSGRKLMESGRVRWVNLEERVTPGPHPEWTRREQLDSQLRAWGYVRVGHYNSHESHRDVIYRHGDEPSSR